MELLASWKILGWESIKHSWLQMLQEYPQSSVSLNLSLSLSLSLLLHCFPLCLKHSLLGSLQGSEDSPWGAQAYMIKTAYDHKLVPAGVRPAPHTVSRGLRCSAWGPCSPCGENVDTLDQPHQNHKDSDSSWRKGGEQAREQWLTRPFPQGCGARGWRALIILGSHRGDAWTEEGAAEESALHLEGAREHRQALTTWRKQGCSPWDRRP